MEKHFNLKHEVLIKTDWKDNLEPNKKYKEGEEIEQVEKVQLLTFDVFTGNKFIKTSISSEMLKDLYNQVLEIEKNTRKGKYYPPLPF